MNKTKQTIRRAYTKPQARIIHLNSEAALLAASPGHKQSTSVKGLDPDNEDTDLWGE